MTVSNPDEKWRTFRDLQPFYLPFRISRATQRLFPTTSLFQFQDWSNWWCGSSLKSCYFCFQFALNFKVSFSHIFLQMTFTTIYLVIVTSILSSLTSGGSSIREEWLFQSSQILCPSSRRTWRKKKRGAGAVTPLLPWQQPRQGPWPVKAMGSITLMVGIQYQYVHAQDHSPRAAAMAHAASK